MRLMAATLVASAFASIATSGVSWAQSGDPLICRPGGGMVATVVIGTIRVTFTPGTTPAMPASGECVWLDRGFREGEPGVLRFAGDLADARYLADAIFGNTTFYAHVYDDGAGAMIVTRVGP